jgi:hypothetical protein
MPQGKASEKVLSNPIPVHLISDTPAHAKSSCRIDYLIKLPPLPGDD